MELEKHGLKMNGLKKVSGETKDCRLKGVYSNHYLQLNYNKNTGDVWTDLHYSIGKNSWCQYHDDSIVNIGNISKKMTMQEIANMIYEYMQY